MQIYTDLKAEGKPVCEGLKLRTITLTAIASNNNNSQLLTIY